MLSKLFGRGKKKHFQLDKYDIGEDELAFWNTVSIETEEALLIVRVRTEKPKIPDIAEYKSCICVAWEYEPCNQQLPSSEVNEKHVALEAALDDLIFYNNLSFLMGVSNGMGLKEWIFYAKEQQEFMDIFNSALANQPEYPIKVKFFDDPNWEIWKEKLEFYTNSVS